MRGSEGMYLGGTLLAASLLVCGSADGMEPAGYGSLAQSSPASPLPAFVDDERLPDLRKAWQTRKSERAATPANDSAKAPPPALKKDEAMSAARAAMERLDAANRQAPAVRRRAEELSRRFSTAGAGSEPAGQGEPPSAAAPLAAGGGTSSAAEPAQQAAVGGSAANPAAQSDTADATAAGGDAAPDLTGKGQDGTREDAAATKKRPPDAAKHAKKPAIPVQAPANAANKRASDKESVATAGSKPNNKKNNGVASARPKAKTEKSTTADVIPSYMRAFGWDTQPD